MFEDAYAWWAVMCVFSALNIAALLWTAGAVKRRPERRLMWLLAAGYTLGCAWRSVLPVYDVPRIVLFDTALSSVLVGRSVATLAELCFAAQWALLMRETGARMDSPFARVAGRCIFPLIVVAEVCSWYSVLSTSNLGHTFENSLWCVCALLVVVGLALQAPRLRPPLRRAVLVLAGAGAAYAAYLVLVDVPMYWQRWLAQDGGPFLGLSQGLADVASRWTVSADWSWWRTEIVWMTLYFTVGVWSSIALVRLPVLEPSAGPARLKSRPSWPAASS